MKRALKTEMMLEKSLSHPKTRLQRIRIYENQIKKIEKKIKFLQNTCKHSRVKEEKWGNTGNAGYNDDIYGKDVTCLLCDKMWMEEQ